MNEPVPSSMFQGPGNLEPNLEHEPGPWNLDPGT
jgi:hypothetical protein